MMEIIEYAGSASEGLFDLPRFAPLPVWPAKHKSGVSTMLTTKTILGAGWTVSSRLVGRLIDLVTVLVLARTLTPADFGLAVLAMSLIAVVDTVLDIPLIQALTRLSRVDKTHLDTAFSLGSLRGLLLAFVVVVAAWP